MRNSLYLYSLILLVMAACKKSGSSAPNCKVVNVSLVPTGGTPTIANFTYDNDGRLKYVNTGGNVMEYFYRADGFTRRSSSNNGWHTNHHVEMNSSGQITIRKDSTYNGNTLSQSSIYNFEYDNQGQLIHTYKNNEVQPLETFNWSGGNLVKYKSGNVTYILDYYTDKPNRDFSFMDLQIFVYFGTNPAKSKNLLKSLTGSNEQIVFEYEFDSKGNIKSYTGTFLGTSDIALTATQQVACD